jgi:ABC-type bacteriocin/lantibiotic exporter with double-glycine peptidase domain
LTGVRIGIILQSISAAALGLIIGFITTWKLTLVVLCFSPVLLLSTKISAQKGSPEKKSKDKNSFIEQGGQV